MNQPKPFARTAAEAAQELRPMLEAHARRLDGTLLEFWRADTCVSQVRSVTDGTQWLEATFEAQYKLPELLNWVMYGNLVEMHLVSVQPLDAHSLRVRFEVIVVVSDEES